MAYNILNSLLCCVHLLNIFTIAKVIHDEFCIVSSECNSINIIACCPNLGLNVYMYC